MFSFVFFCPNPLARVRLLFSNVESSPDQAKSFFRRLVQDQLLFPPLLTWQEEHEQKANVELIKDPQTHMHTHKDK